MCEVVGTWSSIPDAQEHPRKQFLFLESLITSLAGPYASRPLAAWARASPAALLDAPSLLAIPFFGCRQCSWSFLLKSPWIREGRYVDTPAPALPVSAPWRELPWTERSQTIPLEKRCFRLPSYLYSALEQLSTEALNYTGITCTALSHRALFRGVYIASNSDQRTRRQRSGGAFPTGLQACRVQQKVLMYR
jgi:hypothetical protein